MLVGFIQVSFLHVVEREVEVDNRVAWEELVDFIKKQNTSVILFVFILNDALEDILVLDEIV